MTDHDDFQKRRIQQAARRYMKANDVKYTTALRKIQAIPYHDPFDCNWGCLIHKKEETRD